MAETTPENNPSEEVRVPIMITRDMERRLKERGLGDEDINKLKPEEAWEILNEGENEPKQESEGEDVLKDLQSLQLPEEPGEQQPEPDIDAAVDVLKNFGKAKPDNIEGEPRAADTPPVENEIPPIPAGVQETKIDNPTEALRTELVQTFGELVDGLERSRKGGYDVKKEKDQMDMLYRKTEGLYRELSDGDNLNVLAKEVARDKAVLEGSKIVKKGDFYGAENQSAYAKKVEMRNWGAGIRESWNKLPEEQRKAFGNPKAYAHDLEERRRALTSEGFVFDRNIYYELLRQGYKPQELKMIDRFGGIVKRLEMPGPDGRLVKKNIKDFKRFADVTEKFIKDRNKKQLTETMKAAYDKGIRKWQERKLRAVGTAILQKVSKESVVKGMKLSPSELQTISTTDNNTLAEKIWTPKARNIEGEIDLIEQERRQRLADLNRVVGELRQTLVPDFGLTEAEVAGFNKYLAEGKGRVTKKLPRKLLQGILAKRRALGEFKGAKMDKLLAEKEALRDERVRLTLARVGKILGEL